MSRKIKVAHFAVGVDLIGAKTSMAAARGVELTELPHGLEMFSKGSNRRVVIPWANVKGYELFPEEPVAETPKKK